MNKLVIGLNLLIFSLAPAISQVIQPKPQVRSVNSPVRPISTPANSVNTSANSVKTTANSVSTSPNPVNTSAKKDPSQTKTETSKINPASSKVTSEKIYEYLRCNFKIADNKIICPLIGFCRQRELIKSEHLLLINIRNEETINGKVNFKKVVVKPGTKAQENNQIIIFNDDYRAERAINYKNADFAIIYLKSGISYKFLNNGQNIIDVELKTNTSYLTFRLSDDEVQDFIASENNSISVSCKKINKDIYEDLYTERHTLSNYQYEKDKKKYGKRKE